MTDEDVLLATVTAWRDYRSRPSDALGEFRLTGAPMSAVQRLFDAGARAVRLACPVDLGATEDPLGVLRPLAVVRDCTSLGIAVDWQLLLPDAFDWRRLSHLWPPTNLTGAPAGAAEQWRREHYVGRLMYRHGPGFIQVRDRREGVLSKITITEREHLDAVDRTLLPGARDVPPATVLADLASEHLVLRLRDAALWLPYRVRRWPTPSTIV